ncbi:ATP-binding cassette domain-containing protein, partial [Ornithobacterium rhinotracheale]
MPSPVRIFKAYPNDLSGGQKHRVMIARALICETQRLIADDPTTALDVTVQKAILQLLKKLQKNYK